LVKNDPENPALSPRPCVTRAPLYLQGMPFPCLQLRKPMAESEEPEVRVEELRPSPVYSYLELPGTPYILHYTLQVGLPRWGKAR
jgi:hypothetical protein